MTDTYRVLLVDDERASRDFVEDMLTAAREERFALTWLMDFDEATSAILSGDFDVCLLDYNLGSYTGFDLMQHVHEQGNRLPIVLLTGHGSHEVDTDALRAGAAEYLDKSRLKPVLLARTIRYAIKHQQDKNELEELYRQVHELEQLKTDMIRIAAHDLRTPITAVVNYANFLQSDTDHPLQDYQQQYVGDIKSAAWQMQQIISDILSLERIQETAAAHYKQTVNLTDQVQTAVEMTLTATEDKAVTVDLPETDVTVTGNPAHLREAAANMMSNAVKYTPEGGKIHVSLAVADGEAVFKVQDTGYGIPEEMQERLFQPFYRARSKETRRIEGTGLGLYLVRNIIQRHNGEIIFHSVYGEGSTFGFRVPLAE